MPSVTVVEAVADREGREVSELPPLRTAVDPEALDELFAPRHDGTPRERGEVTFVYCGYLVRVRADGRVTLDT